MGETGVADIEIYASQFCGFCYRAKALLAAKGAEFREIDVDVTPGARAEMIERAAGLRTVPQIFIDGRHIGGSDELAALEMAGELDALIGGG